MIARLAAISMFPRASSSSGCSTARWRLSRIEPERRHRVGVGVRAPLARDVALDRVGHRVHPGGRREPGRERARGLGVEDGQAGVHRQVGDLVLDVLVAILDHGDEAGLRAGAGGGRDAGQGGQVDRPALAVVGPGEAVVALPVAGAAAVDEDDVGQLGRVHDRPAADGEDRVGARRAGHLGDAADDAGVRVLGDAVEDAGHLESAVGYPGGDAVDQAGGPDHLVGDDQHPLGPLAAELEADAAQQVAAGDDPGRREELVERLEAGHLAAGGIAGHQGAIRSARPSSSSSFL